MSTYISALDTKTCKHRFPNDPTSTIREVYTTSPDTGNSQPGYAVFVCVACQSQNGKDHPSPPPPDSSPTAESYCSYRSGWYFADDEIDTADIEADIQAWRSMVGEYGHHSFDTDTYTFNESQNFDSLETERLFREESILDLIDEEHGYGYDNGREVYRARNGGDDRLRLSDGVKGLVLGTFLLMIIVVVVVMVGAFGGRAF